MSQTPYQFFVILPFKAEYFDIAKASIMEIIPHILDEPGCEMMVVHEAADPYKKELYLYERYVDEEAFLSHLQQPYVLAIHQNFSLWLDGDLEPIRLKQLI